ncbi:MAG: hypothetical protein SO119_04740 [Phascolarctobacterium sp.]|nr:hypothetical protein [Phascolarctobacterium sp.]
MEATLYLDNEKEELKIREYLKQIDKKFYYRIMEHRKQDHKISIANGTDERLAVNTFDYVKIKFKK